MSNPFTISLDPAAGLIHVIGTGLWTPLQVMDHFRDLQGMLRRMRAEKGQARVMIDMRDALVQPANTAKTLHDETNRAYREQDRVAVICTKALLAIQMKHAAKIYARATFATEEEARGWLMADQVPDAAPKPDATTKITAGR